MAATVQAEQTAVGVPVTRPPHVVVSALTKRYDTTVALDGLSFTIGRGEVYGLLGPNGAGKSTTIGILSTVVRPTSGTVTVEGQTLSAPVAIRRQLGVVPQELAVYEYLTGEENVRFFGRLFGLSSRRLKERCTAVLELVGLSQRRGDLVREYSGGMKRRLNFAVGVVHEPRLLLLDEPMISVDPQSRDCLVRAIREFRDVGTTVLYTTHYLEEAEDLCDRVGIIDRGRLVAEGTVEELTHHANQPNETCDARAESLRDVFLRLTGRAMRD
jgi:ABC-2 type transport system ATP-binding protein